VILKNSYEYYDSVFSSSFNFLMLTMGHEEISGRKGHRRIIAADVAATVHSYNHGEDYVQLGLTLGISRRSVFSVCPKLMMKWEK
jgi:hypothetical protein